MIAHFRTSVTINSLVSLLLQSWRATHEASSVEGTVLKTSLETVQSPTSANEQGMFARQGSVAVLSLVGHSSTSSSSQKTPADFSEQVRVRSCDPDVVPVAISAASHFVRTHSPITQSPQVGHQKMSTQSLVSNSSADIQYDTSIKSG